MRGKIPANAFTVRGFYFWAPRDGVRKRNGKINKARGRSQVHLMTMKDGALWSVDGRLRIMDVHVLANHGNIIGADGGLRTRFGYKNSVLGHLLTERDIKSHIGNLCGSCLYTLRRQVKSGLKTKAHLADLVSLTNIRTDHPAEALPERKVRVARKTVRHKAAAKPARRSSADLHDLLDQAARTITKLINHLGRAVRNS